MIVDRLTPTRWTIPNLFFALDSSEKHFRRHQIPNHWQRYTPDYFHELIMFAISAAAFAAAKFIVAEPVCHWEIREPCLWVEAYVLNLGARHDHGYNKLLPILSTSTAQTSKKEWGPDNSWRALTTVILKPCLV